MRAMIAFSLVCVSACTTSGQNSPPSQSPSDVEPVAVVSIHVDTHSFKSGEDIEITILLEAGRGGVYIPKEWGHFGGGIPGFSISLTTLSGRPAEICDEHDLAQSQLNQVRRPKFHRQWSSQVLPRLRYRPLPEDGKVREWTSRI